MIFYVKMMVGLRADGFLCEKDGGLRADDFLCKNDGRADGISFSKAEGGLRFAPPPSRTPEFHCPFGANE
jgi:hypothetical protein